MSMLASQSEPVCGLGLGVEVHEHRRLVTHDPCVVPRLQDDNRGRRVLKGAAVSVRSVYPAPRQEAHVGMAAEVRTHQRLHMGGPTEPGRVDEPPDADRACPDDVDLHASDLVMGGPWNGAKKRVHRHLHVRRAREGSTLGTGGGLQDPRQRTMQHVGSAVASLQTPAQADRLA
jgi:hypothetical protein